MAINDSQPRSTATKDLHPTPGKKYDDGTQFGGGPWAKMACSACKAAGYDAKIFTGHRSNMKKYCPVLYQKDRVEPTPVAPEIANIAQQQLNPAMEQDVAHNDSELGKASTVDAIVDLPWYQTEWWHQQQLARKS